MARLVLAGFAGAGLAAAPVQTANPAPARIVAVGDIHGDATTFRAVLRQAGVLDDQGRWSGGQATLVQTGDYLDRGSEVRDLLDLLMTLQSQAAAAGGEFVVLLGNHEGLNLLGDVRYVAADVFRSFADAQSEARREQAFARQARLADARRKTLSRLFREEDLPDMYGAPDRERWMTAHPPGFIEYFEAISTSGRYGAWLRKRPATARVGRTVFLHGGFDPEAAPKTLDKVNEEVAKDIRRFDEMREYMVDRELALPWFTFRELLDAARTELARVAAQARAEGNGPIAPGVLPPAVVRNPLADVLKIDDWALVSPRGPLWFRGFATWTDAEGDAAVPSLATRFDADRFVVGHSITKAGHITPRFGNRVFLIDTGMSSVYRSMGGRGSALEIRDGTVTAIYETGRDVLAGEPVQR